MLVHLAALRAAPDQTQNKTTELSRVGMAAPRRWPSPSSNRTSGATASGSPEAFIAELSGASQVARGTPRPTRTSGGGTTSALPVAGRAADCDDGGVDANVRG